MSWKKKIRQDYDGILSKKQIEATIKYWDKILAQELKKERERMGGG